MNLNKCRGCHHVVYAPDPMNSWCWKDQKNIRDLLRCEYGHIPVMTNNKIKKAIGSPNVRAKNEA